MRQAKSYLLIFFLILLPTIIFSQHTLKEQMLNDLDIIKNSFEVRYAPAEWKKTFANWDLEEQIQIAKDKVNANESITLKDYHHIVKSFLNSTRDYHVSAFFFSTEASFLPFRIQGAEGKYFITWVDNEVVPYELFVGDELIEFNGSPINEAINDFKHNDLGNPESLTDQALAEMYFTTRVAVLGHNIPKGPITIKTKSHESNRIKTHELSWFYMPEEIEDGPSRQNPGIFGLFSGIKKEPKKKKEIHPFYQKSMHAYFAEPLRNAFKRKQKMQGYDSDGSLVDLRKGDLPPLGSIVWQSPEDYHHYAYIFKTPDQRMIGFIRLPNYIGDNETAMEFAKIMNIFENKTDALVIDQLNNTGGIVLYMYSLASMLATKPLYVHPHQMTLTQSDVYFALLESKELESIDLTDPHTVKNETGLDEYLFGYPVDTNFLKGMLDHSKFILSQWNSGNAITQPGYLFGIEKLTKHPSACYTKPILVLVNSLAFSCGDFFPALLQDNKRATIFGAQTAGAGGYVLSQSHPNRLGIAAYSITGSIAERPDKNPIENLGVTPDIHCEVTAQDLQNGYADYSRSILETLRSILPPKPKPKPWF